MQDYLQTLFCKNKFNIEGVVSFSFQINVLSNNKICYCRKYSENGGTREEARVQDQKINVGLTWQVEGTCCEFAIHSQSNFVDPILLPIANNFSDQFSYRLFNDIMPILFLAFLIAYNLREAHHISFSHTRHLSITLIYPNFCHFFPPFSIVVMSFVFVITYWLKFSQPNEILFWANKQGNRFGKSSGNEKRRLQNSGKQIQIIFPISAEKFLPSLQTSENGHLMRPFAEQAE